MKATQSVSRIPSKTSISNYSRGRKYREMSFRRSLIADVSAFLMLVALCSGSAFGGRIMDDRMECRSLPAARCAFAVNSYGARCVLETAVAEDGTTIYQCQTSDNVAYKAGEYIESEDCVTACGLDRMTVGISTDIFYVPGFAGKLCSIQCQTACANIVDLFSSVVASAASGASLDRYCNEFYAHSLRREMRAGQFSMSDASAIHGISPSSSVGAEGPSFGISAEGPSSDNNDDSNGPAEGPSSAIAEGPEEGSSAEPPTAVGLLVLSMLA